MPELGLRVALGAGTGDVLRRVLGRGMALVLLSGLAAVAVPAVRAARVDPVRALREQ